ncbi:MAG: hypothetical protein ACRDGO_06670 [Actinomycetota bacterium]
MSRDWYLRSETGAIGPAILLGLVGATLGAILGFFGGGAVAYTSCSLGVQFECMDALLLLLLPVPAGALVGAITGVVIGVRKPKSPEGEAAPDAPKVLQRPPAHREAPASSWLGVVGGLATAVGAFGGWRVVRFVDLSLDDVGRFSGVLTPGPETFGLLGGVVVLVGGTLRILRPAAPAPTSIIAVGALAAVVGLGWAVVDLVGVPDEARWGLLFGYWWSLAGSALSLTAWLSDARARRRSEEGSLVSQDTFGGA